MVQRIYRAIRASFSHLVRVKKNANPVKWGIIGLGNMAEVFTSAIDGSKEGIVYAVASRNIEKASSFASRHSCSKAYGNYDAMLNDPLLDIDVVYIATPVKFHYENIKKCIEANKNVLCEKPITSNSEQLEELILLAKEKKCFLMEGMWMKCLPTFRMAAKWIDEGKIGQLDLIKVDFYKREYIMPELAIFNAKDGGGVLRDYGIYAIAFMTKMLGGDPDEICFHSRNSIFDIDSDWSIFAKRGNIKAFVNISSDFSSLSKAAVMGKEGTIEWNSQFNRTNGVSLYDKYGKLVEKYFVNYSYEGYEFVIKEVHDCIKGGRKQSEKVPLYESFVALKVIDRIS